MWFNNFLLLSLLIIIPPKSSSSLIDLVSSLIIYEDGVNSKGICVPYINTLKYPTIGYGEVCKFEKVQKLVEAKKACSSYTQDCDEQKAKQWLRNTIVNRILCIQNKDNIKNAFNKAFKFRRVILVSLAFQLGCNNLAKYEDFLSYMAKGDWARAADEMFNFNWATELQDRIKRYSYVIKNNKCKDFCQNYGWN